MLNEDVNCRWLIAARPEGNVKASDFEYSETPIPEIQNGEFLLRTLYLGMRPVMRMYMQGARRTTGMHPNLRFFCEHLQKM